MKTNPLSLFLLFAGLPLATDSAWAGSRFDCLRDLIPVTDRASLRNKRNGVETPFFINNKSHIVFPEVERGHVSGFFLYGKSGAWYYDAIEEAEGQKALIRDLKPIGQGVYELVAQPEGLETIAILFLPGYRDSKKNKDGPVVLGASVLPVVGALVSRPEQRQNAYSDPTKASDEEISRWLRSQNFARNPAGISGDGKPVRTLARLTTVTAKDSVRLWSPLEQEYKLRREWIKNHNLDEQSFRNLTRIMDTTCKD